MRDAAARPGAGHGGGRPPAALALRWLLLDVRDAGPPLLFGVRVWLSTCLALYLAFWLQLDHAYWAGVSAAIVCQPHLGASLRKGWFRMVGTVIGAVAIVVISACFPQQRLLFLGSLALWAGLCTFAAALLRNFAAYAGALAAFTAAVIAGDQLGDVGGLNGEAFSFAMARVSEICLGIVSAGVVLAGTDFGGARRRLAALVAALAAEMSTYFVHTLELAGAGLPDTQPVRRDFLRRVIALDPVIDEAIGESSTIRYRSRLLQHAVDGFVAILGGWRAIGEHLPTLPAATASADAAAVLALLPQDLRAAAREGADTWTGRPTRMLRACEDAAARLTAHGTASPSLRLLADQTAHALIGLAHVLNGLALLTADPARPARRRRHRAHLRVPDWLPAIIAGLRALVVTVAVAALWVLTPWPGGATAIVWAVVIVSVFAPQADHAYSNALRYVIGSVIATGFAAFITFAVLPATWSFTQLALVLGAYIVPAGALMAQPWAAAIFAPMAAIGLALIAPENQVSYDPAQFYNGALALLVGCLLAMISFRLIPPLSPAASVRRLLMLSLRDLRRLAAGRPVRDWSGRLRSRITALPEEATPLERARMLAILATGRELVQLRGFARQLDVAPEIAAVEGAIARRHSAAALAGLARSDAALAARADTGADGAVVRARACALALTELLRRHGAFLDAERVA